LILDIWSHAEILWTEKVAQRCAKKSVSCGCGILAANTPLGCFKGVAFVEGVAVLPAPFINALQRLSRLLQLRLAG